MREVARTTVGPWGSDENHSVTVVWEVGSLTTPDLRVHPTGLHRVRATHTLSGKAYQGKAYKGRAKTFKGETAFDRANNLFGATVREIELGR